MPATLELPAVRRFAADMTEQLRRCDDGTERECLTLAGRIDRCGRLCRELREYIRSWSQAVFAGRLGFEQADEDVLKAQVGRLVAVVGPVAAEGRTMCSVCQVYTPLPGLPALTGHLADLDHLLRNWVSPRLAVGPAARVVIPDDAARRMRERLADVPPLPDDWQLADPKRLGLFD